MIKVDPPIEWPKALLKWPISSLDWYDIKESGFNSSIGPVISAHSTVPDHTWYASLTIKDKNLNLGGVCHGGVLMALADIAMGHGSWYAGGMHQCATIQMDSQFLAAGKKGQTILAIAKQKRRTKDLSFMTCGVWAADQDQDDSHGDIRHVFTANGIWKYLASHQPKRSPIP